MDRQLLEALDVELSTNNISNVLYTGEYRIITKVRNDKVYRKRCRSSEQTEHVKYSGTQVFHLVSDPWIRIGNILPEQLLQNGLFSQKLLAIPVAVGHSHLEGVSPVLLVLQVGQEVDQVLEQVRQGPGRKELGFRS